MHYLDWVILIIFEFWKSVTQLLVDWDYLALGFVLIEVGGCVDNLEFELIVRAVHVSVCQNDCKVPGPKMFPLSRKIGQEPFFLVYFDEFIGFLWDYYDRYRIILIICVGR